MSHQPDTVPMSRPWLIASGLIFIQAGMAAMSLPVLATIVIITVLAYFVLATGLLSLGILIYLGWPASSFTVLGVFFGINLLFKGVAQLALGMSSRSAMPAAA